MERMDGLFGRIFLVFFIILVLVSINHLADALVKQNEKESKKVVATYPVQSIDDKTDCFTLGYASGYKSLLNKDAPYYACYKVNDDGGKKITQLWVESTTIYDTLKSNGDAYVEEMGDGCYRLYVPKNYTVTSDFEFEMGE